MSEHYLSDRTYFRLVRRLAEARDTEAVKIALGDAGIWPDSVRQDLKRADKLTTEARARLARQAA